MDLNLYNIREDDFGKIIKLAEEVHGKNYVDYVSLEKTYRLSCSRGLCCSKVIYDGSREKGKLIGFRLTYAPGNWEADEWCSPEKWKVPPEKICYFKNVTLAPNYRGLGLGGDLLKVSMGVAKQLGAEAGVAHIWMRSPNNAAYRYFSKAGGQDIRIWPSRWAGDYKTFGYECGNCGKDCDCPGTEMILYFGEQK